MFALILRTSITIAFAAVGGVLFLTTAAEAQKVRFISSTGVNTNNCTRDAPCRTLQRGINATPVGGELHILDSDAYGGNSTINKSITISAVGVSATVGAITINAPDAAVVLRGVLLSGISLPNGQPVLSIVAAAAVHIVGCQVERGPINSPGISIDMDQAVVFVTDTIVRDNGSAGVVLTASSENARLLIENSRFEHNFDAAVSILGSGQVTIERSVLARNFSGLSVANAGATALISNSTVTLNIAQGLFNGGGTLASRGNNTVYLNGQNISGSVSAVPGV